VNVRPATPADAGAIAAVQLRTWLATYSEYVEPELILERADGREERWLEILTGERRTLVAEAAGRIAGFASWGACRDDGHDGVGELYAVSVAPDAQGAGVGTALHEAALAGLGGAGFTEATLWVFERNARARAFYDHAGWHEDRESLRHNAWAPELRYRRSLACS
jgi:ribosomal protein S18 acetylase RimI-like enzyme